MPIRAVATDDDGAVTEVLSSIEVYNVAPTIGDIEVWIAGVNTPFDANGTWVLQEDQTVILRAQGDDTLNDRDGLILDWNLSDVLENFTASTDGTSSDVAASWPTSGEHIVSVRAVDDDGESSSLSLAKVTIQNVPPTIVAQSNFLKSVDRLNGITVEEDDLVEFDVVVDDTSSDIETLVVCWDVDATLMLILMEHLTTIVTLRERTLNTCGKPVYHNIEPLQHGLWMTTVPWLRYQEKSKSIT